MKQESPEQPPHSTKQSPVTPRSKRQRQSAEQAKKRIKLEYDSPDKNHGGDFEHACEIHGCENRTCFSCDPGPPAGGEFFHLTSLEHVCTVCYENLIRIGRPLFDRYTQWKRDWLEVSRCAPNVRVFANDQLLPFYANCLACGRFRRLPAGKDMTPAFLDDFCCESCDEPESTAVVAARELSFIGTASAVPLLIASPAVHYLREDYFLDEIGVSPLRAHFEVSGCKTGHFMSPFNIPSAQSMAFCVRPDVMDFDEVQAFPEYGVEAAPFLAMRNLVVALWNLDPFKRLTFDRCLRSLICRGVVRVWYSVQLRRVFDFLELKSVINNGLVPFLPADQRLLRRLAPSFFENPALTASPSKKSPRGPQKQPSVIVIGAGISGLGVARQLTAFGAKVTIFEAKQRIGGRLEDDWSLGVAVGLGAQLITGIVNNPVVLMCEQRGVPLKPLRDACPLVDSCIGRLVNSAADRLTDEHFNSILDAIGQWKSVSKNGDISLMEQIALVHEKLLSVVDFRWTKEHERLFQWQIGNVEFSCGSRLTDVSARNWDQNESIGQFAGEHALLTEGSSDLTSSLADGLDVRCAAPVHSIDSSDPKRVVVTLENGKRHLADRVVVAVPLAALHRRLITFVPELPDSKTRALANIGAGLIEKVAVRFPRRFWAGIVCPDGTLDYFGNVPKSQTERGCFNMFYDFSTPPTAKRQQYVLMSYVCGDSVNMVNQKSDAEVVDCFVEALQELFPEEKIPAPTGAVVTHWGRDVHIGMSYSYLKVGGTGEDYDELAKSIDDRVFFCGESTNRFFPQTMTGAYVSALREAGKVAASFVGAGTN